MGLDMYLNKHIYVGANFDHRDVTGKIAIKIAGKPLPVDFKRVTYIIEQVAYWRKANHIHNWFVQNVQEGVDDCKEWYVSRESFEALLHDLDQVLAVIKTEGGIKVAEQLLPTTSGFFFGGTEYDEWYIKDCEYTREIIIGILNSPDFGSVSYYYESSW